MTWRVISKAAIVGLLVGLVVRLNILPHQTVVGGLPTFANKDFGFPTTFVHYHLGHSSGSPSRIDIHTLNYPELALNCAINMVALAGCFLLAEYVTRRGDWRFRIHLSTIILLVIAAGIALGLNMRLTSTPGYGWPLEFGWIYSPEKLIAINLIYNGLMLITLGALCERFSRKQKEAGAKSSFVPAENR